MFFKKEWKKSTDRFESRISAAHSDVESSRDDGRKFWRQDWSSDGLLLIWIIDFFKKISFSFQNLLPLIGWQDFQGHQLSKTTFADVKL